MARFGGSSSRRFWKGVEQAQYRNFLNAQGLDIRGDKIVPLVQKPKTVVYWCGRPLTANDLRGKPVRGHGPYKIEVQITPGASLIMSEKKYSAILKGR